MQKIAEIEIKPTEMVSEGSWGSRRLGKHASTMTLWADRNHYSIEWEIPSLDECEHIGLTFEHKTLIDYDGVFSLPREAVVFLREQGFIISPEFIAWIEPDERGMYRRTGDINECRAFLRELGLELSNHSTRIPEGWHTDDGWMGIISYLQGRASRRGLEGGQVMTLVEHATRLIKANPEYAKDARVGAPIGNSIIGSILSITTGSPRWATEQAVVEALRQIDRKRRRR